MPGSSLADWQPMPDHSIPAPSPAPPVQQARIASWRTPFRGLVIPRVEPEGTDFVVVGHVLHLPGRVDRRRGASGAVVRPPLVWPDGSPPGDDTNPQADVRHMETGCQA